MSEFYDFSPEVPGGIGENTRYDKASIPWKVEHLHVIFEGWLGAEIMNVSPCYFVNERFKTELEKTDLTGISGFQKIETSLSENFIEMYPGKNIPDLFMISVNDLSKESDFYVNDRYELIISENALKFIKMFNLSDAVIRKI